MKELLGLLGKRVESASIGAVFGCLVCEFIAKVPFVSRYIGEGYSEGKFFDHGVDSFDGDVFCFPWVA